MSRPMPLEWRSGEVCVTWSVGGVTVDVGALVIQVDAPLGIADRLDAAGALGRVHGVIATSGRLASVRGLLALLEALAHHRREELPLPLWAPLGEERVPALLEAWQRGWPERFPVVLDGAAPGDVQDLGGVAITFTPLLHGEPTPRGDVIRTPGCGVRLEMAAGPVVYVPGAAPTAAVRRACRDVALAIVEVGVRPWPASDRRWRLSVADALDAARDAEVLWIVGDDGAPVSLGDA